MTACIARPEPTEANHPEASSTVVASTVVSSTAGPLELPAVAIGPAVVPEADAVVVAEAALTTRRSRRSMLSWRRVLRWSIFAAVIALETLLVLPHLSFSTAAFGNVSWSLLAAAVLCEAISIITFSRMRRALLRTGGVHMPLRQMGVLTLATNAISATAPAGPAVSTAYLFQQLRRKGANTAVVTWTVVAGTVMSGLAFTVITVAGTMLDGDVDFGEILGAAGVSVILGVALVSVLAFASSHPAPLLRAAESVGRRIPARWRKSDANVLHERAQVVIDQLTVISPRTRDWALAFVLAVANWAADLACFVLCCYAVGAHGLTLGAAAVAYVAGLATISLTLTPGGLGSVEAGMLIGLAHGGVAAPIALAGIVAYRLVAYVLVGAVGWAAWVGLRRGFQSVQVDGETGIADATMAPATA